MHKIFGVILFIVAFVHSNANQFDLLKVTVYYESLCPACREFISNQVYPTWKELNGEFELSLVPYGGAHKKIVNGKWEFTCQHGPDECYGNKIQGCILETDELELNSKLQLIACIEEHEVDNDINGCITVLNITNISHTKSCIAGPLGDEIMAKNGDLTEAANPKITAVPSVYFNDAFDVDNDTEARMDLKSVICRLAVRKPVNCNNYYTVSVN